MEPDLAELSRHSQQHPAPDFSLSPAALRSPGFGPVGDGSFIL